MAKKVEGYIKLQIPAGKATHAHTRTHTRTHANTHTHTHAHTHATAHWHD